MSKRIKQKNVNGTVVTRTTGDPRGTLPNFDVSVVSHPRQSKKATEMTVDLDCVEVSLDGRQARTLYEVLSRHFEEVDQFA